MIHRPRSFAAPILACVVATGACSRTGCRSGPAAAERKERPPSTEAPADEGSASPLDAGADDAAASAAFERAPLVWVEPPWPCDAIADVRARPCLFAPAGRLVRTSGASSDAAPSAGCQRVTVFAGDKLKLAFVQGGALPTGTATSSARSAWQVRCDTGRVELFWRDAVVPLSYEDDELGVDPSWIAQLDVDARYGARPLAEMEAMLLAIRGPELRHGGEALLRVRLLMVERALRVQNRDKAELVRQRFGDVSGFVTLNPWVQSIQGRLNTLDEQAPLRAGWVQVLGTVASEPVLPLEEDAPTLFWRGAELCLREEAAATPSMRCVSPRRMNWGRPEPYVSPFADGWKVGWETRVVSGRFTTTLITVGPDGTRGELGPLRIPTLVARAAGHAFAAVSAPDAEANEPVQTIGLDDFDLSATAGSRLTALGYYFERPDRIRSLTKVGTYWNVRPSDPLAGIVSCKTIPLVSPDLRWAACVGETAEPDAGRGLPLVAFELVRTPVRRH